MLSQYQIHPTLPASDFDRAKKFYGETLGFKMIMETPAGAFFESGGGTRFLVFPSQNAGSNPSTYAGWEVDSVENVVSDLKSKGVKFEEYDSGPIKTENSIATTPVGQAAWFKDSEGNIMGVVSINK